MKFFIYHRLVLNRINSLMMLTMEVFLKHVRSMNYNSIYSNSAFLNRRIMNAVFELKSKNNQLVRKTADGRLPDYLLPSEAMTANFDLAFSMGTTLWVSKAELKKGMLDAIIACGEYTACWNFLEYIEQLIKEDTNTNVNHLTIVALEPELKKYCANFKNNPLHYAKKVIPVSLTPRG